jgi:RHS repeat-associated protein
VGLIQYDAEDRVTQVTDALNHASTVSYDGNGNALSVTLPSKAVISETYDLRNRPLTRTDAMNQSESWAYDGMNHVLSHTDRKGQATIYSYDALNRRSLVSYADGSTVQPSYDAANRLTGLADSSSGSLSWGYDGLDRLTSAVTPQATIGYTYDAAGRRTSMTPAAQAIVNYVYDNANRLTSLTQGSETVQFGYDAANRRTSLILPNAISMAYAYDAANELTGINYVSPTNTAMGALTYGYDLDGRRISKTGSFATDVLPASTTAAGTFDANNRQTTFNGTAQTYDANGNLTSNGIDTFVWNARNQLTQINAGSTTQFSYAYDALGRRTSKSVAGASAPTTYLYDGMNAVQEAVGSVTNPILTGLGVDERFARNDVNGRTDLLTDALNSTIALTDPTGKITQQYSYDPYGSVTMSDTSTGFTNPYLYTGREADSAGLYYYRARYYSPAMGRFISEDPIGFSGGQNNFYGYVAGNPIGLIDPLGLAACPAIVKAFFQALGPTINKMSEDMDIDPNYMYALSAYESGWYGPHAQSLNNPFGLTHGGGNDINFGSIGAAAQYFEGRVGPSVADADSFDQFVQDIRGEGYNSKNPNYDKNLKDVYKSVKKFESNCDCTDKAKK